MPTIASIVAYYQLKEPDGFRLLLERDSEDENLADVMNEARTRLDDGYAAFIKAGGNRDGAIRLLKRQLQAAGKLYSLKSDEPDPIDVVGGIDMLERLGALKRDINNGVYISFIDVLPPLKEPGSTASHFASRSCEPPSSHNRAHRRRISCRITTVRP